MDWETDEHVKAIKTTLVAGVHCTNIVAREEHPTPTILVMMEYTNKLAGKPMSDKAASLCMDGIG